MATEPILARLLVCGTNKAYYAVDQGWAITFLSELVTDNELITGLEAQNLT